MPEGEVDLCDVDPGFDIDLYVSCKLSTMTAVWMGYETDRTAISDKRLMLVGNRELQSKLPAWLGLSPFAQVKRVAG